MNDHFRDTVFGQVVRLFSRNRLLKFPDELDPTLWKQCVQKDTTAASSTFEEHDGLARSKDHTTADRSDGGEKGQQHGTDLTSTSDSGDTQALYQGNPSHEKTKVVCLVDWYGPDDQEVSYPTIAISVLTMLTHAEESAELVGETQGVDNLSDMHPELWDLYWQLHLHAWRAKYHGRIRRQRDCDNTGSLVVCPVCIKCPENASKINLNKFVLPPFQIMSMFTS